MVEKAYLAKHAQMCRLHKYFNVDSSKKAVLLNVYIPREHSCHITSSWQENHGSRHTHIMLGHFKLQKLSVKGLSRQLLEGRKPGCIMVMICSKHCLARFSMSHIERRKLQLSLTEV